MANYVCIRVIARPVKGAEEDFRRLCEDLDGLCENPDDYEELVESIGGDASQLWFDIDNYEPAYSDDVAYFQLIARWNFPRFVFEEGFCDNYVVDYDVVFADEFETYDLDYSSNDADDLLEKVGCIGVFKMRRTPCEDPDDGFDIDNCKYFFPQSDEEKHLMYLYAWAESFFSELMDRQKLYHTNPEDPDDEFFDLRDEMDLQEFFDSYKI